MYIEKYYDFYCLPTLILQSRYTPLRWLLQWKFADIEENLIGRLQTKFQSDYLSKNILHREMRPVLHLLIEHTSSLNEACSTALETRTMVIAVKVVRSGYRTLHRSVPPSCCFTDKDEDTKEKSPIFPS